MALPQWTLDLKTYANANIPSGSVGKLGGDASSPSSACIAFQDWRASAKSVTICTEGISSTYVPWIFAVLYTILRSSNLKVFPTEFNTQRSLWTKRPGWPGFASDFFYVVHTEGARLIAWITFFCFFWFWIHTASALTSSGTHTVGGAVIRKPGGAWLEGTPTMDPGLEGIRTYV